MSRPNPLRTYAAVTAAYWAFMLSDGALRMLVLLHFNALGFSPVQLAWSSCSTRLPGSGRTLPPGGWRHASGWPRRSMAGLPCRSARWWPWRGWRSRDPRVNRLSLARMFLFGARDVWFVVGIPIYFQAVLTDGSAEGRRAAFFLVGGFMALWIIAYGAVRALAPRLLGAKGQLEQETVSRAIFWAGLLVPIPFALALAALVAGDPAPWLTATLVAGLVLFGFVFAVNSSVHSCLILAFGSTDRITRDVGFYYMANAAGRLIGTLLSGLSFQIGGLPLCLATAGAMAAASWLAVRRLSPAG